MRKTAKELTQQYAEKQFKVAANMSTETDDQRSSPIQSNDIVNMNSIGGALADYFAPAAWGGERAGRAQVMAESSGQKTPFNVRNPLTTSFASQVAGGVIGGTLGGVGAYNLVDSYLGSRRQNNLFNRLSYVLFPTGGRTAIGTGGAIAGSVAGTLLSTALTGLLRRKQMATIGKGYDEALANGTMSLKPTKFNRASTALLPFRGSHRAGQNDAYKAISSNKPVSEVRPRSRDLGYATTMTIGPIAAMTPLAPISAPLAHAAQLSQQLGMNYHTQFEQDARNKANKEKSTKEASLDVSRFFGDAKRTLQPIIDQANILGSDISAGLANPETRTLTAGALGTGLGAFHGLVSSREPHEERLNKIIRNALYGGALGAGGAMAFTHLQNRPRGVFPITESSQPESVKVANSFTDFVSAIPGKALDGVANIANRIDPGQRRAIGYGLTGAGIGAGLGLLGGMRRPAKERSLLSDAAMGAAAGGAAGVGIPAVMRMFAAAGNTGRFADGLSPEVIRQGIEEDVAKSVPTPFSETSIGQGLSALYHRPLTTAAGAAGALGIGGVANSLRHASHASANSLRHASHAYRDLFSKLPDNYWLSRVTPDELVDNLASTASNIHPNEVQANLMKEVASIVKQNPALASRLHAAGMSSHVPQGLIDNIAKFMPDKDGLNVSRLDGILTPTAIRSAAQAGRTRFSPYFGNWSGLARNPLSKMRLGRAGLIGGGALLAADALLPTMTDRSTTSLFTGAKP